MSSTSTISRPSIRAESHKEAATRLLWVEYLKAFALIWIVWNHAAERLFGYPLIANPGPDWPPLTDRVAQLYPLQGFGVWDLPVNLLRYAGWFGDQGVGLFVVASGFGLTWGLLHTVGNQPLRLGKFYLRRAERVYPMWWMAHLVFAILWLLTGKGFSPLTVGYWLSFFGIRITPELLYLFAPAWWYVGLLIQLYFVYPLIWEALRRYGPTSVLIVTCGIAVAVRGAGLLHFDSYVDAWNRGAFFVTRLPEFVVGVYFAARLFDDPEKTRRMFVSWPAIAAAVAFYLAGTLLSLTWIGLSIAPLLLAVGAFIPLYALFSQHWVSRMPGCNLWRWTGEHSYPLYLVHHPLLLLFVPMGLSSGIVRAVGGIFLASVGTLVAGVFLEKLTGATFGILRDWYGKGGVRSVLVRGTAIVGGVMAFLIGAELLVRALDPQEPPDFGWGERASLERDAVTGWRLIPNQTTRLRWESYDYTVTANALGFPGPEYATDKDRGALRIMVVGDAFSSAEGVDTAQAWPRVLEAQLQQLLPKRKLEVMNFAITGYGPNQYAAVVEEYAPQFRPDLIIVSSFVNDGQDALMTNAEFQESIGFAKADPNSIPSILRLAHLRRFVTVKFIDLLVENALNRPNQYGYFLGNFAAVERSNVEINEEGNAVMRERLAQIKQVAEVLGARILFLSVPASIQVCDARQLPYYPDGLDLSDKTRFDIEQPQRLAAQAAEAVGIDFVDLRPALKGLPVCPYQPRNMHWTEVGHQRVAQSLAELLVRGRQFSMLSGQRQ